MKPPGRARGRQQGPNGEEIGLSVDPRRPAETLAVVEGFLRILGDPPAGTEHDRLADLLSASTAGVPGSRPVAHPNRSKRALAVLRWDGPCRPAGSPRGHVVNDHDRRCY